MSANVDLLRSLYARWERGDFSGAATWAHPEIEFVIADCGPESGSWIGVASLEEAWRAILAPGTNTGLRHTAFASSMTSASS
jgi:ketosteroid isomerase-like protein